MNVYIRKFEAADIIPAIEIWNEVVTEGIAFPQEEPLSETTGMDFFISQTHTGIAYDCDNGKIVGLYILHPNNVGRCGHICNASYAVKKELRGTGIGEKLVRDCIAKANEYGYKILQFNAVVSTNTAALSLYKKLGFKQLGVIPNGFRMNDRYEDIIPHYIEV